MQSMYIFYANEFNELQSQGKDGYLVLGSTVCVMLLNQLYANFMNEGIEPIEKLPQEKKLKFFELAQKYCLEENKQKDRIKTGRAAYALSLITSTE